MISPNRPDDLAEGTMKMYIFCRQWAVMTKLILTKKLMVVIPIYGDIQTWFS